jgi:hypothetical protein
MPGLTLRGDYTAGLLRTARRASCPRQVRRLLALAAVYEGRSRTETASIGGMDRQTLRDWALRFNRKRLGLALHRVCPALHQKNRKAL